MAGIGATADEPAAQYGSSPLTAGGRWIRTSSTRARCIWLFAPFDAPGCLGRVGSRRSDPATTIAERVAFGRVPDKIGRQKGRADPSQAGKRDNQIHRARVLEDAMGRAARAGNFVAWI